MKLTLQILSVILITLCISACKEKTTPIKSPDYSENYKYFPIKTGREWQYEYTIADSVNGFFETSNEVAKYNETDARTDFYRNNVLVSNLYWANTNNKLACCGDVILLDYNQIDCNSDSVLIYQNETSSLKRTIYQYCSKRNAIQASNYTNVSCLKTRQTNINSNGRTLVITQYFGFGIGLVYREEITFDKLGKIETIEKRTLVSHNF